MKYDLKNDYDFSDTNLIAPESVLQDICSEFDEITSGFVFCNVREYKGRIDSYEQISPLAAMAAAANLSGTMKVDVQDNLGDIGNNSDFQFELFLSSKYIENYIYRILFIGHKLGGYPVEVVLEQGIADEINKMGGKDNTGYIYMINTKEDFEKFIVSILNSNKVVGIVQDLIVASKRKLQEQLDK